MDLVYELVLLIIFLAGAFLLLALFGGKLVSLARVPKVTGYLLIGLLIGSLDPSVLAYIFPDYDQKLSLNGSEFKILDLFKVVKEVGLGLIVFNIGGEFQFEHFKKLGRKVLWISFYEILLTLGLVSLLAFITFTLSDYPVGDHIMTYSLLLGVIAIATAPAATLLVLREYESEGPITDHILVLVGLNNIVCILAFKILFTDFVKENAHFMEPIIDVLSSIGLGIVVGLLLGFVEKWLEKSGELLLVVLSGIALNIGIAYLLNHHGILHIDHLLANLFMGMTLINSSTKGEESFKAVKNVDLPIYVLFFVLAGANLHVNQLWTGGILFVIYVIGRTVGKFLGSYIGVRFVGLTQKLGRNVGYGLLPQAGVAIGLASILKSEDLVMGDTLSIVILSSVMIFELVGPLFTRHAIVKGGEVKEISLSKQISQSKKRHYHRVLVKLRRSLGFPRGKKIRVKKITCNDLLRSSVEAIPENMPFDEVLKFASHCKYDHFPVINDDHLLVGTISHTEIRDYLLDPEFSHLVIASDIMREDPPTAHPQDSLQKLLIIFHASNDDLDYLPVIDDRDMPHIIGIVTQKDVISAFRKLHKKDDPEKSG